MRILYVFLIAFVNSFDNIGVRVAYSVGGIKVKAFKNILISLMAFAVAFTATYSGHIASHYLSGQSSSIISMLLLVIMGIKIIFEQFFTKNKEEILQDSKSITYKEAISIGTALAIDDIGGAVSVGLVGYNPFLVGLAFFIVSYLIFLSGNYAIKALSKFRIPKKVTSIFAGGILILIGLSQAFM